MKDTVQESPPLFSRKSLLRLLIPVMAEQILTALMGTVDTIMVSNVGSEAISAVSLVDSLNTLVIQAFAALTTGGAIVCSHYVGSERYEDAKHAARQLLLSVLFISLLLTVILMSVRAPLLSFLFGQVDEKIMADAQTYFFYTALSYPFIALYDSGSAVFRSQANTRLPLVAAVLSNMMNIAGNAVGIFVLHQGVAGCAVPTLVSRIFGAIFILLFLRNENLLVSVRNYLRIRPDFPIIKRILRIGVPSGIENSMFQFGKLAVQSTVSTMGTVAIAAQAMTNTIENLSGIAASGVGIGMMTVVGECLGAGHKKEAVQSIKRLSWFAEIVLAAGCLLFWVLTPVITGIGHMESSSAALCYRLTTYITIVKPIVWIWAFIPAYGMRAAGDVRFSMIVSCISMWVCRVALCIFLVRTFHMGPLAVWIGMFTDWTVRGIFFALRFHSRKWLSHKVI
ncbi:MAG: MATE family efflux transporter [Oscillospiraceae bacterium]|nr:MATE family efflux transporter [Oscillospiraceae bacterium]